MRWEIEGEAGQGVKGQALGVPQEGELMNPTPLNYGLQGRRNVVLVPSPSANSWCLPSALFPPHSLPSRAILGC